ncbi:DNA polymerase III subunit beta, partial [bacterium]|nr:DNA polymerase III subunit beta [bacterium]MBU1025121.1 DNA polymerase III subunit beta [bacterium]
PILGNVLIHFSNNLMTLTAYDLEMGVRHTFEVTTDGTGDLALPAKLLHEIISYLPDGDLTLDIDSSSHMEVRIKTSKYDIHGISSEEYPDFPDIKEKGSTFTTSSKDLLESLRKTTYASSKDSARTWTSGVNIVIEDKKLVMIATDGRRLALDRCPIEGRAPKDGISALIPTKTMDDLLRILSLGYDGQVKITIGKTMTQFELGDTIIISHLLDAQFPDYQRVIPKDFKGKLNIDRDNFEQAIRGVSIVAKQREGRDMAILATDADQLTISAHVESLGSSTQNISVQKEGEELKVAFNYQFLMDPIMNINADEIELNYGNQLQPGLITIPGDDDFLYVIMPVRLSE